MRASKLMITILVLAVAVSAFAQTSQRADVRRASVAIQADDPPPVETTRDLQGVWHITGGSLYDVFEAMGYAVATDRLFQMELFRRQARGSLSELFGAEFLGQDFLSTDIFLRNLMYSEDELTELFNALSPEAQTVVLGYVNGVNRRILEIYSNFYAMPYEYWIASFFSAFVQGLDYSILPRPWTPQDAVAWIALMSRNFDGEAFDQGQIDNYVLLQTWAAVYGAEALAMFADMRWTNDPSAQTMIPAPDGAKSTFEPQLPTIDVDTFPALDGVADRIRARFAATDAAIEAVGAKVKMGSYAWAVSGDKTASGNPIVYSGPQMGFTFPPIVAEGSINGGGLNISGMTVPGIPAIIIGRTPHHAWSMQVGHAHTQDWFFDSPLAVSLHRWETFYPAGGDPVTVPIFRTHHGPIVDPFPYNPAEPPEAVVSWAYAHWGREAESIEAFLKLATATSMAEFDAGIEQIAVSQHFTYADRNGNIAYWMSGVDPIRAPGTDPRLPLIGDGSQEWTGERRERAHDSNTDQGFYGGWNNKASPDYDSPPNNFWYCNGTWHRAHVVEEYLAAHDGLEFEEVRDLALNIATTSSFQGGGNPWAYAAQLFTEALMAAMNPDYEAALAMLEIWDGHFVAGGPPAWRFGPDRADAWVLQDAWIREVERLTFEDEFMMSGLDWQAEQPEVLTFNVLLHALNGQTFYDWFQDKSGSGKPTTADGIIAQALDNVIADIGLGPYGAERGYIYFGHSLLGSLDPAFNQIHSIPFSERSTFAHVVEYGPEGPVRIESMWPLGPSGFLEFVGVIDPVFSPYSFSMAPAFDPFMPRPFPLFE